MVMRTLATVSLTLVVAAAVTAGLQEPRQPGLTVHEWGTFTTVAGEDGRAVAWRPLDGAADLPCFVERAHVPPKFSFITTVRMETPVIYFYAPVALTVDVEVGFRSGVITELYPRPSPAGGLPGMFRDPLPLVRWTGVRIAPGAQADFPVEPGANHYYEARATDAASLDVAGQTERFIFYRGVGGFRLPLRARVLPSRDVEIVSDTKTPIAGMMLFENRGGRAGYRTANGFTGRTTMRPPASSGDVDAARAWLAAALTKAGLYPREAEAMVATWRDTWFEEGTRLFYLVPRTLIDETLPLDIRPVPGAVERVFVARLELATPSALDSLATALVRDTLPELARHGRFLEPFARRAIDRALPADRVRMQAALARATTALRRDATHAPCATPPRTVPSSVR